MTVNLKCSPDFSYGLVESVALRDEIGLKDLTIVENNRIVEKSLLSFAKSNRVRVNEMKGVLEIVY